MSFLRLQTALEPSKPVEEIELALVVDGLAGRAFFTDLMLQAGRSVTGWVPRTEETSQRAADPEGEPLPARHFCAAFRGPATLLIPNHGTVPVGPDISVEATETMPRLTITGPHGARPEVAPRAAETATLNAQARGATLDGEATPGWGRRFLLLGAGDAHVYVDPDSKPADEEEPPARPPMRVVVSIQELTDGPERV